VAELVKLEPKAKVLAAGFNDGGAHLLDNTALSILAFNVILPDLLDCPKVVSTPQIFQFYGKPHRQDHDTRQEDWILRY
jgi:hypothetical protein